MAGTKSSGGRNAKSRSAHLLEGTFRKHRHAHLATPTPPNGKPRRPRTLSGVARAEWNRMVKRLAQVQTLSVVDDAVLNQYCQLHAETELIGTSHTALKKLSDILLNAVNTKLAGEALAEAVDKIVTLQVLIAKQTAALRLGHLALRQYLVEFGMTPAARTRVTAQSDKAPANPLDRYMKPRKGNADGYR